MAPEEKPEQNAETSRPTLKQRVQLLRERVTGLPGWAKANRRRTALIGVACLLSIGGVVFGFSAISSGGPAKDLTSLEQALDALDRESFGEAQELANRLQEEDTLLIEEYGGPVFILGAVSAYAGDEAWPDEKPPLYLTAARYLEEARDRGFPEGRRGQGLFLLGKTLYLSGQIPASRLALREALEVNREKKTEIHGLLARAYLEDAQPQAEQALKENTAYLSDARLPAKLRQDGLLQRAQVLLRLNRIPEAVATLEQLPADATNRADATVLKGQARMLEARNLTDDPNASSDSQQEIDQKYREAINILMQVQGQDTLGTQATRKAMYLLGECNLSIGQNREALALFTHTAKRYTATPEGVAASFQEAELQRQSGKNEEALAGYRRALGTIDEPENYSNPWISLEDLREGTLAAYQGYLKTNNFDAGLQLAKICYPLFPQVQMLEMMAEAYVAWGDALLEQADAESPDKAELVELSARSQYRRAGSVYLHLAKLEVAQRSYPDRLWSSAEAYFRGHDFRSATRVVNEYLTDDTRRRRAQALVLSGESMMSLGNMDKALEAFEECVAFYPRDVAASRARLLGARGYHEKGDMKQARKLLEENLHGRILDPESREWQDSLFALGELLHAEQQWNEALVSLSDAVRRYEDDPRALQARYWIADSLQQSARQAQGKRSEGLTEPVVPLKQIHQDYNDALDMYRKICEDLRDQQDKTELTSEENVILRNSNFAIGSIEFALGNYGASMATYKRITSRFQNSPDVLEAFVQIANCYERLDQMEESRMTLKRAQVLLGLMKPEVPFAEVTNYTRKQWEARLQWRDSLWVSDEKE